MTEEIIWGESTSIKFNKQRKMLEFEFRTKELAVETDIDDLPRILGEFFSSVRKFYGIKYLAELIIREYIDTSDQEELELEIYKQTGTESDAKKILNFLREDLN